MLQLRAFLQVDLPTFWHSQVERLFSLSSNNGALVALGLFVIVALVDLATPPGPNITFAYVFVVVIAAWNTNFQFALALVFVSLGIQLLLLTGVQHHLSNPPFYYVSLGNRLFTLLLAIGLIMPLRKMYIREKGIARIDFLTSLPNRQAFREFLLAEIDRRNRDGFPFAMAYIDLDNFKAVNDQSGHEQGDRVLIEMGRCISNAIRRTDIAARQGGDEFAILFHRCDLEVARHILNRMRKNVKERMAAHRWPVTLSIGVALFDVDALTPDSAMSYCDTLMYEAKRAGRNATICGTYLSGAEPMVRSVANFGAR